VEPGPCAVTCLGIAEPAASRMFAARSDVAVAAACFGIAEPVALCIFAELSDSVAETGTSVAADSQMPESVASSGTLARPDTSAGFGSGTAGLGSSSGFALMRIGAGAKIDIAASANSGCAEPESTHSDILVPRCVPLRGSRNDLHKARHCCRFALLLSGKNSC